MLRLMSTHGKRYAATIIHCILGEREQAHPVVYNVAGKVSVHMYICSLVPSKIKGKAVTTN